jgi:hypothetical protein
LHPSPPFPYVPSHLPSASQDFRPCMIALCSDSVAQPAAAGVASLSLLRSTMAGAEMTGSATEQLDVDMDSSLLAPAGQPGPTGSATEQPDYAIDSGLGNCPARPPDAIVLVPHGTLKWEIRVSFNNDMWWAMPHELSDPILQEWHHGAQQVSFVWDWEKTRKGSYQPDGEETSISRYIIDFDKMEQRNLDNGRTRKVQVVGVLP